MEEPSACGQAPPLPCHTTGAGMLGPALLRSQVVEVRSPRETRVWAAPWMRNPVPHAALAVHRVGRVIQERARHGPRWGVEPRLPARFFVLTPRAHPVAVGLPGGVGDMSGTVASPLAQGQPPPTLPRSPPGPSGRPRCAPRRAHRGRERRPLRRELGERVAYAGAQVRARQPGPHPLGGAVNAISAPAADPRGRFRLGGGALTRPIGVGQGHGPGLFGGSQGPDDPAADHGRQVDVVCQPVARLCIGQDRRGQGQTTPGAPHDQTRRAHRTAQARAGR